MKLRILYICLPQILALLFFCLPASGELEELTDSCLEEVHAASGISIGIKNVQLFNHIDSYKYCAPDNGGSIQFNNIQFTDGQGGDVVKYNFDYTGNRYIDGSGNILLEREGWYYDTSGATPVWDFGTGTEASRVNSTGLIYFNLAALEVASEEDWAFGTVASIYKGMGIINVPSWDQELGINIEEFVFSDGTVAHDLGSIDIGRIDIPSYDYYFAPHAKSGLDFEYAFEQHIDHIAYFYGDDCSSSNNYLAISDIHMGEDFGFGSAGDDPSNPSTWTTNIGKFRIGDMFGDLTNNEHSKPAQFDVAAFPDPDVAGDYYGAMVMTLPMSGSIRFENVEFDGTDFGPGAIDGINVSRMNLRLIP